MLDIVHQFIEKHQLLERHTTVVVGVSGGSDSLALLHFYGANESDMTFKSLWHTLIICCEENSRKKICIL